MAQTKTSNWLHERLAPLMGPSLLILIGSSMFRGLLGLLIGALTGTFGTYNHWNPFVRIPIEVVVFFGVFIASDICFANTIGNVNAYKRDVHAVGNEEAPRFKGNPDAVAQQAQAYEKGRQVRIKLAGDELRTEKAARFTFGAISVSYAVNFIAQSLFPFNDMTSTIVLAAIEIESVFASVYVVWYYSGRYKEERADPVATATGLIETGMQSMLESMRDRFTAGEQTDQDLNVADVALPGRHHYRKFVRALRTMPTADDLMTTGDIFATLGMIEVSDQRRVRNTIKKAFDANTPGVFQVANGAKSEWRVAGSAFYGVLGKFIPNNRNGAVMDNQWTTGARKRPARATSTGQRPDNDRTTSGHADAREALPTVPGDIPDAPIDQAETGYVRDYDRWEQQQGSRPALQIVRSAQ